MTDSQKLIAEECDALKALLLEKNRKYGDSVLNPKRIFSSADSTEQIKVRIDDKLSRLANLQPDEHEDVVLDLLGYLILLRVATRKNEQESTAKKAPEQKNHSTRVKTLDSNGSLLATRVETRTRPALPQQGKLVGVKQ